MEVKYGSGKTEFGPGVSIELTGEEVATAIDAWLVAHDVCVRGPRTITVAGELCGDSEVYVDPSGFVIFEGEKYSGRGPQEEERQTKKFTIWSEGYRATGQSGTAQIMGQAYGETFKEACIKFFTDHRDMRLFNAENLTFWGCSLFPDEARARKFFG